MIEELILAFIRESEGGVTNTRNVASRFGWSLDQARTELKRLSRVGSVSSRRVRDPGANGTAILEWRLA